MIEVYTDGACSGNPGPGGWGVVLLDNGQVKEYSGREPHTTNQRMEVLATIKALEQLPPGTEARLWTDSQYVVKSMNGQYRRKVNLDLWQRLDALAKERKVRWEWVRGHAGDHYNERANDLAQAASNGGIARPPPPPQAPQAPAAAPRLSHLDAQGKARMVDVSEKPDTAREAIAKGRVAMQQETLSLITQGKLPKGDVLAVARTAGIMGAKRTPDLIPMCHPLLLSSIQVDLRPNPEENAIDITATVRTTGKTGVEMEALTAVAVAGLTIYDMCKAVDRGMRIESVRLVRKSGGTSGTIELE